MGTDIHIIAQRKTESGFAIITDVLFSDGAAPFDWRSYGLFGFLAGVRNYSDVPPISPPRGLPEDYEPDEWDEFSDLHSCSWLSVEELSAFYYEAAVEDRRVERELAPNLFSGAATAEPGGGKMMTYREFLGQAYFDDLAKLVQCGAARIVFGFYS